MLSFSAARVQTSQVARFQPYPTLDPAAACRWSRERYQAARDLLVAALRRTQAAAGRPFVLRSQLREEARKAVGAPPAASKQALGLCAQCVARGLGDLAGCRAMGKRTSPPLPGVVKASSTASRISPLRPASSHRHARPRRAGPAGQHLRHFSACVRLSLTLRVSAQATRACWTTCSSTWPTRRCRRAARCCAAATTRRATWILAAAARGHGRGCERMRSLSFCKAALGPFRPDLFVHVCGAALAAQASLSCMPSPLPVCSVSTRETVWPLST